MSSTDIATRDSDDLVARAAGGSLTEAERVLVGRLVKLRPGQAGPSREELATMIAEANHLNLDVFARECYFIKFDEAWECYPHYTGLIKIAEATGQYRGCSPALYSDDGETWTKAWVPDTPPRFCRVTVYREGRTPTEVTTKFKRVARTYVPKGGGARRLTPQWEQDPEGMLAKSARRLAVRIAFQREVDKPLSGLQLKALHTLASLKGLKGDEGRPERLGEASEILGRPVDSFTDLSAAEATVVIDEWVDQVDGAEDGEIVEPAGDSSPAGPEAVPGQGGGSATPVSPAAFVAPGGITDAEGPSDPGVGGPEASAETDLGKLWESCNVVAKRLCETDTRYFRPKLRKVAEGLTVDGWESFPKLFDVGMCHVFLEEAAKLQRTYEQAGQPWE